MGHPINIFVLVNYDVRPKGWATRLVSEPERAELSVVLLMLKQIVSRRRNSGDEPFWQHRYYDFNVWSQRKFIEKLRYMHRNPVRRGLVTSAEHWPWSSYRHYLSGIEGTVEIESEWTANQRERMGIVPRVSIGRAS